MPWEGAAVLQPSEILEMEGGGCDRDTFWSGSPAGIAPKETMTRDVNIKKRRMLIPPYVRRNGKCRSTSYQYSIVVRSSFENHHRPNSGRLCSRFART